MKKLIMLAAVSMGLMAVATSAKAANVVADFTADFQSPTPATGWSYLWNPTAAIGDPMDYSPLVYDTGVNAYDVAGNKYPDDAPASFLILRQGLVHPGQGSTQSAVEHFVIAGFTVPADGFTSITDFATSDADVHQGSDGFDVFLNVNNKALTLDEHVDEGGSLNLANIPLGNLKAGDTVFVGIGAHGDDFFDSTNLGFKVSQGTVVAVPLPSGATSGLAVLAGIGAFGLIRRRSFTAAIA